NSGLVEVYPHHGAPFSPDHLRSGSSHTTFRPRYPGTPCTDSHFCVSSVLLIDSVHRLVSQDIFLAPIDYTTELFRPYKNTKSFLRVPLRHNEIRLAISDIVIERRLTMSSNALEAVQDVLKHSL